MVSVRYVINVTFSEFFMLIFFSHTERSNAAKGALIASV